MVLGNAYIQRTVGHGFHHNFEGAACRHGRGNAENFIVFLGQLHNGVAKNILILWRLRAFRHHLNDFARVFIKETRSVPLGW